MGDLGQHSTAQLIYSNFALLFFFFMIISTYETVFETFLFAGWITFQNRITYHFSLSLILICFVDKEVSEWYFDRYREVKRLSINVIYTISTGQHFVNSPHLQSVLHTSRVISFS